MTPHLEQLEERLAPYSVFLGPWSIDPISFSVGAGINKTEVALALQTWANRANLNFVLATGVGDIAVKEKDIPGSILGYAAAPGPLSGGDIVIDSLFHDQFGVLLHEAGHALGLGHSKDSLAVMYQYYNGFHHLSADDVAGIRHLYGKRPPDPFEANDISDLATAVDAVFVSNASLHTNKDKDWYSFTAETADCDIAVKSTSLLAPAVKIYDGDGNVLAKTFTGWGKTATLDVSGLTPGDTYFVLVNEKPESRFAIGKYEISID